MTICYAVLVFNGSSVLREFLKSAKGAVRALKLGRNTRVNAADGSSVLREFLKSPFVPYLVLLAAVLTFFRHVLFVPGYVIPWDLRSLHLPFLHSYADSLAAGHLPLWDPYSYGGRPILANVQAAVLYPSIALIGWLGAVTAREHLLFLLEINVVAHVFLAGLFAYRLGRRLGLRIPAALFGGITYELSGFFAAHAEHMGGVMIAAWLPLAWSLVLDCCETPRLRPALLLAAVFALCVLAGLTPLTAIALASSGLLALLLVLLRRASWRTLAAVSGAGAFGLVLALAQLVPTAELNANSISRFRADYLSTGGGTPVEAFISLILPNYLHIFEPALYNQPTDLTFMYLYCGLLALAFACAALVLAARNRMILVFGVQLICCILGMLGDETPAGRAMYAVLPASLRISLHPELVSAGMVLSLAILAALAADHIIHRESILWCICALAALDLILVSSGRPMNAMRLADDPGVTRSRFAGHAEPIATLKALTRASQPPSRIDTVDDSLDWAMASPITQIFSANGSDPMALSRLIQARLAFCRGQRWGGYYQVENLKSPILGLMNIEYLLSRRALAAEALAGSPFAEATRIPGSYVYRNRAVLPRFFLVSRVRPADSESTASAALHDPSFDPASEAIVEGFSGSLPPDSPPGSIRVMRYEMQNVELSVDTAQTAYLVTSEVNYPGWRAYLDGRKQQIYYTNVAFRGMVVPPGRHTILMRFEPVTFWWSMLATGIAWLAWGVLFRRSQSYYSR